MHITDLVEAKWTNPDVFREQYVSAEPFPHIVMEDFIRPDILKRVEAEFPDLAKQSGDVITFDDQLQIKLASRGMGGLSESAFKLISGLNSDVFLNYLQSLTGIDEPLISDPYLAGGGYHEIKTGGLLKVHADFNKHSMLDLDRRLNLLIYLNKNWNRDWGGELQLFNADMSGPVVSVPPRFNTAVVFTTTSYTYHGHPDPLACPPDRSRRSLALYYFSTGRPDHEVSGKHSTLFKERQGESWARPKTTLKSVVKDLCPPILIKAAKSIARR